MYVCRRDRAKFQDYVNKLLFKRISWIIYYTRQAKKLGQFLILVCNNEIIFSRKFSWNSFHEI